MTILPITRIGDPVLLARAAEVDGPPDTRQQALIDDMIETLAAVEGLGLAAPQVGVSERIILVLPVAEREERDGQAPMVLVDPTLEALGRDVDHAPEGCLSIPDLRGVVPRARRIFWRAHDRHGRPIEGEAEGLFARILQHEVDHLNGILFPMRMTDLRLLATSDQVGHLLELMEKEGRT
jgi:peptide deformylase